LVIVEDIIHWKERVAMVSREKIHLAGFELKTLLPCFALQFWLAD
jgi:hypothetical protein